MAEKINFKFLSLSVQAEGNKTVPIASVLAVVGVIGTVLIVSIATNQFGTLLDSVWGRFAK